MDIVIKQLWLSYKLYYEKSRSRYSDYDSSVLATESTNGYLEYVKNMVELFPEWQYDIEGVLLNQIRILGGLTECYDRPVIRDAKTEKTRWTL